LLYPVGGSLSQVVMSAHMGRLQVSLTCILQKPLSTREINKQ